VLPGTLIHTNPNLVAIEQLHIGNKVLGLDGRYHRVREVFSHRHQGKIYRLKAKCFGETVLTPEHPVLMSRRRHPKRHNERFDLIWERVDRIRKGDYLAYPIPTDVVDVEHLPLPEKLSMDRRSTPLPAEIEVSDEFCRLAGYYLAEGWIDTRPATKGKIDAAVGFSFHIEEREYVDDLRGIVRGLFGIEVSVKEKPQSNQVAVYVNSSRLARAFRGWFGSSAEKQRLPHFLLLLPLNKQQELLKGLWRGDGWIDSARLRAHYKTISKTLCEQIKLLLLRQGIASSIQTSKASGIHRTSYAIYVLGKRDFPRLAKILELSQRSLPSGKPPSTVFAEESLPPSADLHTDRRRRFLMVPVVSNESFEYDGEVWNLEVEDAHCYVSENAILHNCGDFGILNSIQMTLAQMDLEPHRVALFSGIGCSAKTVHYVKVYGTHTLHGRVLPFAIGAKLANPDLTVIAVGGDGDGLGIGAGHFVNAGRRNVDLTYVLYNNGVYGLTKGQASPTLKLGVQTKSLPQPNVNEGVNPLLLALSAGYTFIARGYAFDIPHLVRLIQQGIEHKGSAFIDVLQPCPTYNDINTKDWYGGLDRVNEQGKAIPRVYKLEEPEYDPVIQADMSPEESHAKLSQMVSKALEWGDRIPIGVFLKNEATSTYEERISQRIPSYREASPAQRPIQNTNHQPVADLTSFFEELRVT
jgi:2-oxoglutarate ferredoxin oxidoreductase subunit beta